MSNKCPDELSVAMFLDNELPPGKRQEVATHLETCSQCREHLQQMEKENAQIKEVFKAKSSSVGCSDLTAVVMEKLAGSESPTDHQQTKVINLRRYRWPLAAAASLLLAVFLVIFLLLLPPGRTETAAQRVVLCSAKVDGQEVRTHIYQWKDPDIQFIWLEKEK